MNTSGVNASFFLVRGVSLAAVSTRFTDMLATVTLFTATEPCALPDGYSDFTLIVRDAAAIAAKNVYTAIAMWSINMAGPCRQPLVDVRRRRHAGERR